MAIYKNKDELLNTDWQKKINEAAALGDWQSAAQYGRWQDDLSDWYARRENAYQQHRRQNGRYQHTRCQHPDGNGLHRGDAPIAGAAASGSCGSGCGRRQRSG